MFLVHITAEWLNSLSGRFLYWLLFVLSQLICFKYQILKILRRFFFFQYFSFNKHLTMWIFLWSGLFLLTSYMMLQKTFRSKFSYLMSLFLWRKWFTFAPTFGKLAPQSSTTLLFCPLHPLEKCYFQGTGRWTLIQWIQLLAWELKGPFPFKYPG